MEYKLKPSRVHMGDSKIRWWEVHPEEKTPYMTLFKPEYWSNCSHFAIDDMIRVIPDERNYMAALWITSTGIGGTQVIELWKKDLNKESMIPISLQDHYRVKYAGPHHRYRVERISDNHIERANFNDAADAHKWLGENATALVSSVAKLMDA